MTIQQMLQDLSKDPENKLPSLAIENLEGLLDALVRAERLESLHVCFWHLTRCLKRSPELEDALLQVWKPTEENLAQLLEDAGREGSPVVLSLIADEPSSKRYLQRLLEIADGLVDIMPGSSKDPWEQLSKLPMVALIAEQQLDQLVRAVNRGVQWKDPKEILDPDDLVDIDVESIIALAQAQMVATGGSGEALNLTLLRLLNWADQKTN